MKRELLLVKILIITTMVCTYIIPISMLDDFFPNVSKIIFISIMSFIYFIKLNKVSIKEVLLLLLIFALFYYTRNINYLLFISILLLPKMLNDDNLLFIKQYLKNSKLLYICLLFTFFYSAIYFGLDGRYAHTGLTAPNQSGLAIFCLSMMILKKNRRLGIISLLFGCLTLSRSYFLAIIIYLLSKINLFKKISIKRIKQLNYLKLTIYSTIALLFLAFLFIYQYDQGNIINNTYSSNRLINIFDYSNFYRFTAVLIIISIFKNNPKAMLFGISEDYYVKYGLEISSKMKIPYHNTVPHNLFLAHLKLYGLYSIIEVIYTSIILKKIIDNSNFYLYIIIFLYSIILGAGLYSYWLYLSVLMFIMYRNENKQ